MALVASGLALVAPGTPAPTASAAAAAVAAPTAYVVNQVDSTVTPVDTATNTAGTPIPVGNQPSAIAITPDGATAYVANTDDDSVTPIDTATNTAGTAIPVGNRPFGIAVTPDGATAYATNQADDNVTPIDLASNTPGTPISVGRSPRGIAITPDGATAYVNNQSGNTVTPIAIATNTAGTPIRVGAVPRGIAITPDGTTVYVTNLNGATVTPIAVATNTPGTPITVGNQPQGIAISPDGATAYVANLFDGTVTPIAVATNTAGTPITVGNQPRGIAITPDGATAFLTNLDSGNVTPLDLATTSPGGHIAVGNSPLGIAITADLRPVDDTDPTVTITTPADGATYDLDEAREADYGCTDDSAGSGVATCDGTVPDGDPLDTSTVGGHGITVTATDLAGNTTSVTHTYTVVGPVAPEHPILTAGFDHTCALLEDGRVKCWGQNSAGQLGLGDVDRRGDDADEMGDDLADVDLGTGRTALAVSAGADFTCALLDDHTVKCWGFNSSGQLGQGDTIHRGLQAGQMGDALPAVDLGTGRTALTVSAGYAHACAVLDDHTVRCWGWSPNGQLGQGDTTTRGDDVGEMGDDLPAIDLGTGRTALTVTAGGNANCALLDDHTTKCWGQGVFGQLGQGDTTARGDNAGEMGDDLPPIDLGTRRTAVAVTAGADHACAVLDDHTAKCWGWNSNGQLGQGDTDRRGDNPGEMGDALPAIDLGAGRTARALTAGRNHTCAVLDDHTARCWGYNGSGQLGQGDTDDRGDQAAEMGDVLPPVDLGPGRTALAVTAGWSHTCALLDDHTATCWGDGTFGPLGQGDTDSRGDNAGEMGDALPPIDLGSAPAPAITVAKTADQDTVLAGADIDYHLTVTNTGNRALTGITLTDPNAPDCDGPVPDLAIGADHTVDCTYAATATDEGTYTNTATADSDQTEPVGSNPVDVTVTIDVTDPTVTITTPEDGATYELDQAVDADYSCADEVDGSGIDTCEGTVPDGEPIDTSTLGAHDVTVAAADNAGNQTALTHTYTVVDCTVPFTDVPTWVTDAVRWAWCDGLVSGYSDNTFRPDQPITRGQAARLLYRAAGRPDTSTLAPHGFRDVTAWINDPVTWLAANNFATGYADDTFRPNRNITRAQLTRMLYRIDGSPSGAPPHPYTDVPSWIRTAVDWIADPVNDPPYAAGYDDGTYRPGLDITRAQTTRMACLINNPLGPC